MSIQSRYINKEVLTGWNVKKFIGSGSLGRTAVFEITRDQTGRQEMGALKVINIFEENKDWNDLDKYTQNECEKHVNNLLSKVNKEVSIMEKLRNEPYIVSYFDSFLTDRWTENRKFGWDFLIRMELLTPLRELQSEYHLISEQEIIKIGKDICRALISCHSVNILHRDIKPDNIFKNEEGKYKLGDFGISRIVDMGNSVNTSVSTPAYCAPEQIRGVGYDKTVDIYSLGLTLYELANENKLPFADSRYADNEAISKRIEGVSLKRPSSVSSILSDIILKACAYNPSNRYQSAEEFLKALITVEQTKRQKISSKTETIKHQTASFDTLPADDYEMQGVLETNIKENEESFLKKIYKNSIEESSKWFELGEAYYYGRNVKKDYKKAVEWLEKAAEQEHSEAQYLLGKAYYNGEGVKEDYKKAVEWFTKAAEQGYSEAQYELGVVFLLGNLLYKGVGQDYKKAVEWLTKAAEQGSLCAYHLLGNCFFKGHGVEQSYTKAVEYFEKSKSYSMYDLGICYLYGYGVSPNSTKAIEYFTSIDDNYAMYAVGTIYYWGVGIEQDYEKAIQWFSKAATNREGRAEHMLGMCFFKLEDYTKAIEWFEKSDMTESYYMLGKCFYYGMGVNQNYIKAFDCFKTAAITKNYWVAKYALGLCYYYGIGIEKDFSVAMDWFYDSKCPEAEYMLGLCYYYGTGTEKDQFKASKYFSKAAENGHPEAQFKLGECYQNGICSGLRDFPRAVFWFNKAANQNHCQALYNLGQCYLRGNGVQQNSLKAIKYFDKALEGKHYNPLDFFNLNFVYCNCYKV